ncbi:nucleotidyltransferase [Vibrio phage Vp_R1]|uniref:Uncharacterized protein n=1 Tax=Vibrio phage Vp_R1 TaxID=2059867 RepID=A0A2H5BPX3_9CAUD|nr:nucleotidyltransferase [Vibrio phage Vp_R1]AUG88378.1 hypothetical protein VPR_014 [Vibrio phage Vp_R1]
MTIFSGTLSQSICTSSEEVDKVFLETLKDNDTKIVNLFEEIPVLKKIATGTMTGVVCGGVIRDADTGRTPRDVDVVIPKSRVYKAVESLLEGGWVISSAMQEALINGTADMGREYMDINGHLCMVMRARNGELELDILVVDISPEDYVKRIPISTSNCLAYFKDFVFDDSQVIVKRSIGYVDSIKNKQVTISDSRINEAYVDKISSYYPDWLVTIDDDEGTDTPEVATAVQEQGMY